MCVKIAFMVPQAARICNASEEPLYQSDDCSDGKLQSESTLPQIQRRRRHHNYGQKFMIPKLVV